MPVLTAFPFTIPSRSTSCGFQFPKLLCFDCSTCRFLFFRYLHWWDFTASVEEVMDSLHILVQQGKVLYLGISDSPAWIVAACNTYAKAHGKTPFVIYQGRWNVMIRDFERDSKQQIIQSLNSYLDQLMDFVELIQ